MIFNTTVVYVIQIAAYFLIGILLLIAVIETRWKWYYKAVLIVLTSLFYVLNYWSASVIRGWPTKGDLPQHFKFLAAQVVEPNKLTGDAGEVFIWALNLAKPEEPPRSYVIDYSATLHEQVATAKKRLQVGVNQIGRVQTKRSTGKLREVDANRHAEVIQEIIIHDMPDPIFNPLEK